jgi:hypothetical protein
VFKEEIKHLLITKLTAITLAGAGTAAAAAAAGVVVVEVVAFGILVTAVYGGDGNFTALDAVGVAQTVT